MLEMLRCALGELVVLHVSCALLRHPSERRLVAARILRQEDGVLPSCHGAVVPSRMHRLFGCSLRSVLKVSNV